MDIFVFECERNNKYDISSFPVLVVKTDKVGPCLV
jgi:hypothetical protein